MKHNPDTQKILPSFSFTYLVTKYKNKQIQIGHIHTNTTETWFARPTSSTKKSHNKLNILNPNPLLTKPQPLSQTGPAQPNLGPKAKDLCEAFYI